MRFLADDILAWVPPFANVITIVAGVIAFFGVLFAYLSAAKLEVRLESSHNWPHQLTVTFTSARANPVQNLLITAGSFGGPRSWADAVARRHALYRHEWLNLMTASASTTFSDPPREGQLRLHLRDECPPKRGHAQDVDKCQDRACQT